jgi:2-methylcitrate dehydratase PrpD
MTDHTTDDTATPTLPDTARRLASYIAQARDTELPADAWECTQLHLIDSIAAVAAGSTLDGGLAAARFAEVEPSTGRSTVIGSKSTRGALIAAFANGM